MTITATLGRSMRLGNETGLSGNQSISQEIGTSISQTIAIAADDVVVAFAGTKENIRGMSFIADQDLTLKVIGATPWELEEIANVGNLAANQAGEIVIVGDVTAWLWPGDEVWIEDTTVAAEVDDGRFVVLSTDFAAGETTIGVAKTGIRAAAGVLTQGANDVFSAVQVAAAGTVEKIIARGVKVPLLGAAGAEFVAANQIDIAGDFSFLQPDDRILIEGATTPANSTIFTVVTAVFTAPDTTIIVEEVVAGEVAAANTTFQWVRTELLIHLNANQAFLWGEDAGIDSPVLEDVTRILATNASGVEVALQGRVIGDSP